MFRQHGRRGRKGQVVNCLRKEMKIRMPAAINPDGQVFILQVE